MPKAKKPTVTKRAPSAPMPAVPPEVAKAISWTCDWILTQINVERVIDKGLVEEARSAYAKHLVAKAKK